MPDGRREMEDRRIRPPSSVLRPMGVITRIEVGRSTHPPAMNRIAIVDIALERR